MPIAFLCHYCGRRLEVPRSQAGQTVSCACGVALTVPHPADVSQREARGESSGESVVFNCPHCRKRFAMAPAAAGSKIRCACGAGMVVPGPTRAPKAEAPPAQGDAAPTAEPPPAEGGASPGPAPAPTGPGELDTIVFNCHHCRKRFTVPADLAGQKGRCTCGLAYVVPPRPGASGKGKPKPEKAAPSPDMPKPPPPGPNGRRIAFNCPRCKRRITLPTLQAGRKANCSCGARFVVPVPGGRSPKELNPPAPAKTT